MSNLSTKQLMEKIQQVEEENQQLKSRDIEVVDFIETIMEDAQKDIHKLIDENASLKLKLIDCVDNAFNISKDPSESYGEISYKQFLQDFIDKNSNDNDLLTKLVEKLGEEETPEYLKMLQDRLNAESGLLENSYINDVLTKLVEKLEEEKDSLVLVEGMRQSLTHYPMRTKNLLLFNTIKSLRNVPNNFHIWEGLIELLGIQSICIKVNKKIYYLNY